MSSRRLGSAVGVVLLTVVAASLISLAGEIPRKINYQGRLMDAAGVPLPGSHNLTFRIFDVAAGGAELWAEAQTATADSAGVFAVMLGAVDSIGIAFDGARWLEIEVDGEVLAPRREMASVPYAFHALASDSLGGVPSSGFSLVSHTHDERYFTEPELSTAGTINEGANPVDWTKLKNVPAGLADGADDVGGAGDGYSLDGAGGSPIDAVLVNSSGNVGIGTIDAQARLHVCLDSIPSLSVPPGTDIVLEDDGNAILSFITPNTGTQTILFGDLENTAAGGIQYIHSDNSIRVSTDGAERMKVRGDGRVVIGTGAALAKLYVNETSDLSWMTAVYGRSASPTAKGTVGVMGVVESGDATDAGIGVWGLAGGETGNGLGVWGAARGPEGVGVTAGAEHTTGRNFGLRAHTSSPNGYAGYFSGGRNYFGGRVGIGVLDPQHPLHVVAHSVSAGGAAIFAQVADEVGTATAAVHGLTASGPNAQGDACCGVRGESVLLSGAGHGIEAYAASDSGCALYAHSTHSIGPTKAVWGHCNSPIGYAGYFSGGRNYFGGRVGIGTDSPGAMLDVRGAGAYSAGGGGAAAYDVMARFKETSGNQNTAILVDGSSGKPAIIYFAEGGAPVWRLENYPSLGSKFQLRYDGKDKLGRPCATVDTTGRVGIGTMVPMQRLQVRADSTGGLKYALKLENAAATAGTTTGIAFKVDGGDEDRCKGAIVYERTGTWNRGDFHILQEAGDGFPIADLGDAVVTIKNNGNVGIGTKTPGYKLQVGAAGDGSEARANAWNLLSSRDYKRDIEPLSPAQCQEILEKATSTEVVTYVFADDPAAVEHLGVIAEDSPREIVASDGKGVSLGDYAAFLLAAIKAQQAEIEALRAEIRSLQAQANANR